MESFGRWNDRLNSALTIEELNALFADIYEEWANSRNFFPRDVQLLRKGDSQGIRTAYFVIKDSPLCPWLFRLAHNGHPELIFELLTEYNEIQNHGAVRGFYAFDSLLGFSVQELFRTVPIEKIIAQIESGRGDLRLLLSLDQFGNPEAKAYLKSKGYF